MKTKKQADSRKSGSLIRELAVRPKRVFAVGDVHGYDAELGILLDYICRTKGVSSDDLLVFVGDYIDRGPCSRQVVERLLALRQIWPQTVFLRGNHEDMLLDFLGLGGSNGEYYLGNGGAQCLASYGIDSTASLSELRARIDSTHLEFFQGLDYGVMLPDFLFVHAGIAPQRSLSEQTVRDLLWIRNEFVSSPHPLGKTVVFGHTAFNQVHLDLPYKIGVDTGVAYGNRLSAVELVEGEFFQIEVGSVAVREGFLRDLLTGRP
jgi:serine/threonine protein phosphatase 1